MLVVALTGLVSSLPLPLSFCLANMFVFEVGPRVSIITLITKVIKGVSSLLPPATFLVEVSAFFFSLLVLIFPLFYGVLADKLVFFTSV